MKTNLYLDHVKISTRFFRDPRKIFGNQDKRRETIFSLDDDSYRTEEIQPLTKSDFHLMCCILAYAQIQDYTNYKKNRQTSSVDIEFDSLYHFLTAINIDTSGSNHYQRIKKSLRKLSLLTRLEEKGKFEEHITLHFFQKLHIKKNKLKLSISKEWLDDQIVKGFAKIPIGFLQQAKTIQQLSFCFWTYSHAKLLVKGEKIYTSYTEVAAKVGYSKKLANKSKKQKLKNLIESIEKDKLLCPELKIRIIGNNIVLWMEDHDTWVQLKDMISLPKLLKEYQDNWFAFDPEK